MSRLLVSFDLHALVRDYCLSVLTGCTHQELLVYTPVLQRRELDAIKQLHSAQRTVGVRILGKSEALRLVRGSYEPLERAYVAACLREEERSAWRARVFEGMDGPQATGSGTSL